MNPTILILGAVLVASGAFAQTDLSKAVPPTPAKPTVSGTLTTITPVAPQKTTSQPGNTMPTETPKPTTFNPAMPKPATVATPTPVASTTVTNVWTPRPTASPWDAQKPASPWK